MKRRDFLKLSGLAALTAVASACGGGASSSSPASSAASVRAAVSSSAVSSTAAPSSLPASGSPEAGSRVLVAYFSATGNTEAVAETIAAATGGELFPLEPVTPYIDADLDYNDNNSRTSRERADASLQNVPLAAATVDGWDTYDTVFVGYPIWWGNAGWPVNGFVTGNDFTGKRVIPFCTSASSGLGQSGARLADLAGTGNWEEGRRFSSRADEAEITGWLAELGLA